MPRRSPSPRRSRGRSAPLSFPRTAAATGCGRRPPPSDAEARCVDLNREVLVRRRVAAGNALKTQARNAGQAGQIALRDLVAPPHALLERLELAQRQAGVVLRQLGVPSLIAAVARAVARLPQSGMERQTAET